MAPDAALAFDGASVTPADPCARLLAENDRVRAVLPSDSRAAEMLRSFGRCERTTSGRWAIVLDTLRADPSSEGRASGRWAFVHVDGNGEHEVRVTRDAEWEDMVRPELTTFVLFDYDGDGEQELVWSVHTSVSEGADRHVGGVMTFQHGAITALDGTADFAPYATEDVDQDGRPDLIGHAPYDDEGDDSPSGFTYNLHGPRLVLHALANGAFSANDAVAKQYARRACPARVNAVFPTRGDVEGGPFVACARMWGVTVAQTRAAITRQCASAEEVGASRPHRGVLCGDSRVLHRWAALAPPLTLP
ncbi:MAG: VCBS repeat-containing protein [Polyangiales bacterium]